MKYITIIMLSSMVLCASAQDLSFASQTLRIPVSGLSINALSYSPEVEVEGEPTPAVWSVVVQIELKRGTQVEINGHVVILDRLREYYTMQLSGEEMQAILGDDYEAVLFAAVNGDYTPSGDVAAGMIAEAMLRLGASVE